MSTTPQDPTTLEFLSDDDYSSLPLGPSTVHAGTRLPVARPPPLAPPVLLALLLQAPPACIPHLPVPLKGLDG
jgi:hypothetical protein